MLKINLKLAFRNIFRNKLYTAINIIGLSVASAFCILVFLYVKSEQSFDRFHGDQSQLFRVEQSEKFDPVFNKKPAKSLFSFLLKDEQQKNLLVTPTELALDLKQNLPEIQSAIRLGGMYNPNVKVGNVTFKEKENITYADADFFQVFNYPLINGTPTSVLAIRNTAAISQRLAEKYFGAANPVGKTLIFTTEDKMPPVTISGVFKNFPVNSSFQYDLILPMESDPNYRGNLADGLNSSNKLLILKLKPGIEVAAFNRKLNKYADGLYAAYDEKLHATAEQTKNDKPNIVLRSFADAHYNQSDGWPHYTDLKNIYQLVCITVVILLIACLNYILLTLTSAVSRSQDVGIRKTIGADRKQIVFKYYVETQLLAFIAAIAGLLLAVIGMPFFNNLTGAVLSISEFSFGTIALMLCVLAIVLGLLAGIYPAMAMSGLKPLNIMRGFSAYKINPLLSKSMVVVQFTICIIFVISALAINKQMHFVNSIDMGFDKDQVLSIRSPYGWSDKQKTVALKNQLAHYVETEPSIQDMTSTSFTFSGGDRNGYLINGERTMLRSLKIDFNYFSFNKIPIIKGRAFSREIISDSGKMVLPELQKNQKASLAFRTVIVNQTLYNMLGKPELNVINKDMGGVIIGVCKDYHTDDLTQKIPPVYHTINTYPASVFWLKIRARQNLPDAMRKLKSAWNQLTGNLPFEYTFLNDDVAKSYDTYLRWMTTITTSCMLAIIIACLGLFGLSGLNTINRTKEIGIRKVLGASVTNLFLLLNRGTLFIATGSFIVAAPIAFYLVHQWLDNFAYRIKPDWELFTTAGIIAMITAVIAVSYHTIKAAMDNPVKSLRSE